MKFIKLFALLLLSLPSAARNAIAEVPAIEGARVTIPYTELKQLLDAAGRAEKPQKIDNPPVEAVLKAARYRLDLSETSPSLTADYESRTITDSWHAIPLCGGPLPLTAHETGTESSVVRSEHRYCLQTKGAGAQRARLEFAVLPASSWKRETGLTFSTAPATVSELRVEGFPEGQTVAIEGLAPSSSAGGTLLFHLPGDGRELQLSLRDAEMAAEPPIVASAWTLNSLILVRLVDGRLQYSARVQAQAESGSGLSLTVMLPPKAGRVTVESEDLDRFQLQPRRDDNRPIQINWKTRDTLDRTFLINWEIPQSPLAETWVLTPPRTEAPEGQENANVAGESRSLVALVPIDGLELTSPGLRSAVESRQLPEWLREQLGGEESLTAEITGIDSIDLSATWMPRLETAQATVSRAVFDTRLVADGSILVSADYTIQHNTPIDWQVDLPSADQILSCEINQKAFKPVQRSENLIEFRLPTPTPDPIDSEGGGPGSKVHLCYSLKSDPLDPVSGRIAVELPRTDLFIHRLDWSLSIPERYEPTAIEGNVELATEKADEKEDQSNTLIRLTKELCRDERPAVEIFYQRKDLTTGS